MSKLVRRAPTDRLDPARKNTARKDMELDMGTSDVEASPFILEGGQLLAERGEGASEHFFGLVQRYEDRLDDLVSRVTGQADEVNALTRAVEVERRAALGARHRLQITQLEAGKHIDEIAHGAEKVQLEAAYKVQLAGRDIEAFRREAEHTKQQLEEAEVTIESLRMRLDVIEALRSTPWYQLKKRRQLAQHLLALPESRA